MEGKKSEKSRLGQAGVKASSQRSHCPRRRHKGVRDIKDASQSYRPRLYIPDISPRRAANKPFRLFDRRDSRVPTAGNENRTSD